MKVLEGSRWLKWCLAKTRKKICREASDVDILYSASREKLDKDHLCGSGGDDGRGPWMAEGSRKGKELLLLLLIKVSESKPPLSWPHMHLSEQNGQALGDLSSYVTLTAPTQKLLLKTLQEKDTTEKSQVGGLVERTMHCSSWADEKTQQDHREVTTEMTARTQARGTIKTHLKIHDYRFQSRMITGQAATGW